MNMKNINKYEILRKMGMQEDDFERRFDLDIDSILEKGDMNKFIALGFLSLLK